MWGFILLLGVYKVSVSLNVVKLCIVGISVVGSSFYSVKISKMCYWGLNILLFHLKVKLGCLLH